MPNWATFNTLTGAISGTPVYGDAGYYSGTLSVSDGMAATTMHIGITVLDVNRPPTISGTPGTHTEVGTSYSFTPTAADPDADPLTFSISNKPAWAGFNTSNGALTGTPGAGDAAASNIVISVSDGKGGKASLAPFSISVNHAPTAVAGGAYVAQPNQTLLFDGTLSADQDGGTLTYAWNFGDGATGTGANPLHTYAAAGTYTATLIVNDGSLNSAPATAQVRVVAYNSDLNRGPGYSGGTGLTCTTSPLVNGSNPINGATGNKYQLEVDYVGAGPLPLTFERHYNSDSAAPTILGANWRGTYDRAVVLAGSVARVYRPNGNVLTFTAAAVGAWQAAPGIVERLVGTAPGWQFFNDQDNVETYDSNGRLTSIANRAGMTLTLSYAAGKLSSVSDGFGRSLGFAYDAAGRLQTLTDPSNKAYTYGYDNANNLASVTYADSKRRVYAYNEPAYTSGANLPHALTGITNEGNKRYATYGYDNQGRGILSVHAGGASSVGIVYNADGTSAITDAKNQSRTYAYAKENGVMKVAGMTGPACSVCGGMTASVTYDAYGFPDHVTDLNGNVTDYDYNARGLEIRRVEALGTTVERTVTTDWHPQYRLPVCVVEPSRTTILTYAANALLQTRSVVDTSNPVLFPTTAAKTCAAISARADFATLNKREQNYSYYPNGLLKSVDGARTDVADVTTFAYDAAGNLSQAANPRNQTITYLEHDADGRPTKIQDANGLIVKQTYDLRGRPNLTSVGSDALGYEVTDYDYNPEGTLGRVALPSGVVLTYGYDDAERLTDVRDQLGNHIHYTLDALGNHTQTDVTDPASTLRRTQSAVYDQANHLAQTLDAAKHATDYLAYDGNGNLKQVRDPALNVTSLGYDALNRLHTVTDAQAGITTNDYDSQDNLVSVTDPRSHVTRYAYDGLGNRLTTVSPDSGTTTNTYDVAGNLLTSTDARLKKTTYVYDALNRVTSVTYADGSAATYTYDTGPNAIGRLSSLADVSGTTNWEYDLHGRVLRKIQANSTVAAVVYTYDAQGRLSSLTTPGNQVIQYGYTGGQLTSMTVNGQSLLSNIVYDPFGPANAWTWGNGRAYSRSFDQDGHLSAYPLGTATRQAQYDPTGNLQTLTDPANSANNQSFGYDPLLRLKTYQQGATSEAYGYDPVGNRTSRSIGAQTYGAAIDAASNRIQSLAGPTAKSYGYDSAGNIVADGIHTYSYDDRGRLTGVDNGAMAYSLNALGQRVRKTGTQPVRGGDANGDGSIDQGDIDAILAVILQTGNAAGKADCNGDGAVNILDVICTNNLIKSGTPSTASARVRYAYDEQGHLLGEYDDLGQAIQETVWMGDTPVAVLQGGKTYNVYTDHLDTPRAITDQANTTVWQWQSDPYGVAAPNEDPDGDGVRFSYSVRLPGQYYDRETGLNYNGFRDYDPSTGRYVQSDPIGLKGGINTYTYAEGSPTSQVDPAGLSGMAVYFSGYQVDTGMGFSLPLGHAGVVAIDDTTGATQYFDFGRYGGQYGDVRGPYSVGTAKIGKDGFPTQESLDAIKATMARQFGKGNFPNTVYKADADENKIIKFALDRKENVSKYPYTLNPFSKNELNFCDTFAKDALKAGSQ